MAETNAESSTSSQQAPITVQNFPTMDFVALFDKLTSTIAGAWSRIHGLDQPVRITVQRDPTQFAEQVITIVPPEAISWSELIDSFVDVQASTNIIQDFWFDDGTIMVQLGLDYLRGTLRDSGSLSRVHSAANDLAFDSPQRLQRLRLVSAGSRPATEAIEASTRREMQMMACFLRYSPRMNSYGIAMFPRITHRKQYKITGRHRFPAEHCKFSLPTSMEPCGFQQ